MSDPLVSTGLRLLDVAAMLRKEAATSMDMEIPEAGAYLTRLADNVERRAVGLARPVGT